MGLSSTDKDLAINSFLNVFFHEESATEGFFYDDTFGTHPQPRDFWRAAEQIEMIIDAYERPDNTSDVSKGVIEKLCNGFNTIVAETTNWSSVNKFNDDIIWAVIAFSRAYEVTGNTDFLHQAELQFDAVWSRGWDDILGGGIWWNTDKETKNTCVNAPACIAASILARNTTRTEYNIKASQIWDWMVKRLYQPSGRLLDNVSKDGIPGNGTYTYNQGTFAGAAWLMSEVYGPSSYLAYAQSALYWTKTNLTGEHVPDILNDEYDSVGDGNSDGVGFKGIFVRWCAKYAKGVRDDALLQWLEKNAVAAWSYRNDKGLTWAQWWHQTGINVTSWECSSGVVVTQVVP